MNVKTIEKIDVKERDMGMPVSNQIKQYAINNYAKDLFAALVGKCGLERGYSGVGIKAYYERTY